MFSRFRKPGACRAFRHLRQGLRGLSNLPNDGLSGFGRVGGLGDGPAHHQVACTGSDSVGRRGDPLLVSGLGTGWPDARDYEDSTGSSQRAQSGGFLRGANKAADTGRQTHPGEQFYLFAGRTENPGCLQLLSIHAGEDGDGKQFGRVRQLLCRGAGRGEHRRPAERVDREHARAMGRRGANGPRHRVRDVVQLQIEEDRVAAGSQQFQNRRTGGGEKLQAHLEPATPAVQSVHQFESGRGCGRVQGYNQPSTRFFCRLTWQSGELGRCGRMMQRFRTRLLARHNEIVKHLPSANLPVRARDAGRGHFSLKGASLRISALVLALLSFGAANIAWGAAIDTNPMNHDPQVRAAYAYFHELDFPNAVARFKRYHEEHPGSPQATAYLLNAEVFQELYRLDLLDTTFYANDGFLSGKHATVEDPEARARIMDLANEVVSEADWRLKQNPNDVNALFARGWARSLECAYIAMAERGFSAGFHLASKAKDDEQRVLQLDPNYVDAKLVVGVYEYVVGALPWPFKFLIGFAGISGSKSKGMAMLRDAGERGVITSTEARTVMALFLRREGKYNQAIEIVRGLEHEYPRNFLFRLEEANLRKDAGEGMAAVTDYREVIADARKPGYFPSAKIELAEFGLGDALRGQRHYEQAAKAYERAASAKGVGTELKIRSLVAGGKCRDVAGERQLAIDDYQEAIEAGPNTSRADTARKYLRKPYHGS